MTVGQGAAASLRAHDDALRAVLLSALPGEAGPWPGDEATHRRAGALLRLLHEAEPGEPWDGFADAKSAEYEQLLPEAVDLLSADVLDFVRAEVRGLAALDARPVRVPCHRDYTPRNWLVSGAEVRVIDFELVRRDVWVGDLARLETGAWRGRSELRAAFLSGYGRVPDAADAAVLRTCAVLTAARLVVAGHEYAERDLELANRQVLWNFMNRRW